MQEQLTAETQGQHKNMVSLANQADSDCRERIKKLNEDHLLDSELVNKELEPKNGELYKSQTVALQARAEGRHNAKFLQAFLNTAALGRDTSRNQHRELYQELQGERTFAQGLRNQCQSTSAQLQAVRDELHLERIRSQVRATKIQRLTEQLRNHHLEPVRLSDETGR